MIASSGRASAQTVSIGVKGGFPLLDRTGSHDESRPYLIGPFLEIGLPAGFAVEAGALYQRIGNTVNFGLLGVNPLNPPPGPGTLSFINRQRGNAWEFSLLGKHYFRSRTSGWQPFLGTGYAFRTVGLHSAISETTVDAGATPHSYSFQNNSRSGLEVGAVFAAGARFGAGRVSWMPEIRYTRWGGSDNLMRKNEAGLLLGIRF